MHEIACFDDIYKVKKGYQCVVHTCLQTCLDFLQGQERNFYDGQESFFLGQFAPSLDIGPLSFMGLILKERNKFLDLKYHVPYHIFFF